MGACNLKYAVGVLPYKYRLNDETEGSTGFRAPRKLYRHPRVKFKGVYRFPRGSKSCRPRGFHRLNYTAGSQSNRCLY